MDWLIGAGLAVFLLAPAAFAGNEPSPCDFKSVSLSSPGGPAQGFPSCNFGMKTYSQSSNLWRYIAVTPNGELLVTSNFGSSNRSSDTGSRSFYVFPVKQKPNVSENPISKTIQVQLATGQVLQLSADKRKIIGLTGAQIEESEEVLGSNNGGVNIEPSVGVVIDCGWRQGGHPIESASGKCQVKSRMGANCGVSASLLRPIVQKTWKSPEQLNRAIEKLLSQQCPKADFSSLMKTVIPAPDAVAPAVAAPASEGGTATPESVPESALAK